MREGKKKQTKEKLTIVAKIVQKKSDDVVVERVLCPAKDFEECRILKKVFYSKFQIPSRYCTFTVEY